MCESSLGASSSLEEEVPQNFLNKYKEQLVELHKDIVYMCKKCILKSDQVLEKFEKGTDDENIAEIEILTDKLLTRMSLNIDKFRNDLKSHMEKFKKATLPKGRPDSTSKKKSVLSLIRNTEDSPITSEDGDMHLSTSPLSPLISDAKKTTSPTSISQNNPIIKVTVENIDDSDFDSQKTTILSGYEIHSALKNESIDIKDEIVEERTLKDQTLETNEDISFEEVDPLAPDDSSSAVPENSNIEFDLTNADPKQLRKENDELLELLRLVVDRQSTAEEADVALRDLDSSSSGTGSINSSIWYSDDDSAESERQSESDIISSSESHEDDSIPMEVEVRMDKRIDSMNDDEIDRLCDLHKLNKKKCKKLVKLSKRNQRRFTRVKSNDVFSSTSSSSDSDDDPEPEKSNLLQALELEPVNLNNDNHDVENIADMICANLSGEETDNDEDSSSETDIETENRRKKRKINPKNEETPEIIIDSDEEEDATRNNANTKWRQSPLLRGKLWSDSEPENRKSSPDSGPKIQGTKRTRKKSLDLCSSSDEDEAAQSDSSGAVTCLSSDSSDNGDIEFYDDVAMDTDDSPATPNSKSGRKNIRAVLTEDQLNAETKKAKDEETQRIARLEEHSKTVGILLSQCSQPEGLVLDVDVDTGTPLITVDPRISHRLKDNQKEGVKFMWEACYESVDMIKNGKKPPTGCILAHCMGLGKTFQVISLVHTLFAHSVTNTKHVLIVCPLSTILNWEREFEIVFNLVEKPPNYNVYKIVKETLDGKFEIVKRWWNRNGVLIIGYEAFVSLNGNKKNKLNDYQRDEMTEALVNPGADLIVCDEGHLIKNGKAQRSKALMQVRTKRRIILTGTPIQNNLREYYVMVNFVKPRILGTLSEYTNRFVNPIMNGQFMDSTQHDTKLMKKRNYVLNKLLKKTIQRADYSVLQEYLPSIYDYTLYIKLQPIQMELYKNYIDTTKKGSSYTEGFWNDFNITKYICTHPHALNLMLKSRYSKKKKEQDTIQNQFGDPDLVRRIENKWWEHLNPPDVTEKPEYGSKLIVMGRILDEAALIGDKVLIFSGSRIELDVIEHFLKTKGTNIKSNWVPNVDYYRMDGTVRPQDRNDLCDRFNDPSNTTVKVFLIAHKVGGLGLNITAANRVIIVSSNFNPCHDSQSIFRAYRFGQTKPCYVYRLVALGTMEDKIYKKGVVKLSVAGTVVDKYHIARHYQSKALQEMYNYNFEEAERPIPIVPKDKLLAKLLLSCKDVFEYLVHQDLLENRPEEELDDAEKQLAWDEFNHEEAMKNQPSAQPPQPIAASSYQLPHNTSAGPSTNSGNPIRALPWVPTVPQVPNKVQNNRFRPNQASNIQSFFTKNVISNINNNTSSVATSQGLHRLYNSQKENAMTSAGGAFIAETAGGNIANGGTKVPNPLNKFHKRSTLQNKIQSLSQRPHVAVDLTTESAWKKATPTEFNYALNDLA